MPNIKLVLTDMDGTIVMPGMHEVSERVREAVIACENAGVTVAAVTGRPIDFAQNVLNILGFEGLCVFDGGATIRNAKTGEIAWSQWLEPDVIREVIEAVLPYAELFVEYGQGGDKKQPYQMRIDEITERAPSIFVPILREHTEELEQILQNVPGIAAHFDPQFAGDPAYTSVQVTHEAADKYHGVMKLMEVQGVTAQEVLAIGDGNNDLPLFAAAGTKIAMGNATEKLKAEADYITASVEQDGFADAMERFVLSATVKA